jgi:hypothetical protein
MDHFAGLDVSVKETSVCIVDDTGKLVREVKVASEPEALLSVLESPAYRFKRIGLEAGPLYTHFVNDDSALGTLGVYLFFVLSGYLISGILSRCRD